MTTLELPELLMMLPTDYLIHENSPVALGTYNNANVSVIIQKQGFCIPLPRPPVIQVQQQADKQWTACRPSTLGSC